MICPVCGSDVFEPYVTEHILYEPALMKHWCRPQRHWVYATETEVFPAGFPDFIQGRHIPQVMEPWAEIEGVVIPFPVRTPDDDHHPLGA